MQKKKKFFFWESVAYPFVKFEYSKKGLLLSSEDNVKVLNFVKTNRHAHI